MSDTTDRPPHHSPSAKLQLAEGLWDDLTEISGHVPVYDWQKNELARRKAVLMANPASALTCEAIQQRARKRRPSV